jgi:hypothetical protein
MRTRMVAGNWKMNKNLQEGVALATELKEAVKNPICAVVIGTPFIHLATVSELLKGSPIKVAAENCADHEKGAYTGEVSAEMVKSTGAEYVILGHSEHRQYYAESYEMLLAIYLNSGDYVSMADILLGCNNAMIRDKYIDYCIMNPEFSLDNGYYGTDQIFKITIPGKGRIFYTLDGSDPDLYSSEYTVPLLLTKGEYNFKVCVLNPYGIWSPVAERNIIIQSEELYEAIEPNGGRVQNEAEPQTPEIIFGEDGLIYIDGIPFVLNENGELLFYTPDENIPADDGAEAVPAESVTEEAETEVQAEAQTEAQTPEEGNITDQN